MSAIDKSLDGNKTALTHRITADAIAYMDGHGFKPIETEVFISESWIADICSFAYFTPSELTKMKFIEKEKFLDGRKAVDHDAAMRFNFKYGPIITMAVEVKVTIEDFKRDISTKFNGKSFPAHICAIAFPVGMLDKDDIPKGWVGLPISEKTRRVTKPIYPMFVPGYCLHPQHPGDVADFIAMIAIRRDHRTRYASQRDWWRMYRAEQSEEKKLRSITRVMYDFVHWLGIWGEESYSRKYYYDLNFEEWWNYEMRKRDIPKYFRQNISKIEEAKKKIGSILERE